MKTAQECIKAFHREIIKRIIRYKTKIPVSNIYICTIRDTKTVILQLRNHSL